MEKDLVPSENNKTNVRSSPSSVVTQQRGEGHDSEFSDDVVGNEYLHLSDSRSSSVLENSHITNGKKKRVESLNMKPTIIKKPKSGIPQYEAYHNQETQLYQIIRSGHSMPSTDTGCNKTNSIRIFGVDIHVPTDNNPAPLRCFVPETASFIQVEPLHDPSRQRGGHVESNKPQAMDEFSRILQNIEARHGVRSMSLCKKELTKSDVLSNLNRLFITQSEKLMRFLIEEGRRVEHEDKNIWLDVLATDPNGESHELHLKLWRCLHIVVLNGKN